MSALHGGNAAKEKRFALEALGGSDFGEIGVYGIKFLHFVLPRRIQYRLQIARRVHRIIALNGNGCDAVLLQALVEQ